MQKNPTSLNKKTVQKTYSLLSELSTEKTWRRPKGAVKNIMTTCSTKKEPRNLDKSNKNKLLNIINSLY